MAKKKPGQGLPKQAGRRRSGPHPVWLLVLIAAAGGAILLTRERPANHSAGSPAKPRPIEAIVMPSWQAER